MRNDPGAVTAALVVELDEAADPSTLHDAVDDAGGEVIEALEFDCWLVHLPETGIDGLCSLDEVVRVETDATLERGVDETVDAGDADEPASLDDGTREV